MTRTWLNRLFVIIPLVATASTGFAQAPKPAPAAAPTPSAVAAAPAAAPSTKPTAPAPAAKPMAPAAAPAAKPMAPTTTTKPVVAAPAAAAPAAPMAMPAPKPAPELDQLKFLMGKWRCDGKQFANPMFGPEHAFKATAENKADVDGFWNQFTYEEKKSKEHHGFKVHGLWGWDQGGKHLVRTGVTNMGDIDMATSPGLEGDKIVWTGDFSGPMGRMAFRHTFTKKSDKEWGHLLEIKDPTGKFAPSEEVSCKR